MFICIKNSFFQKKIKKKLKLENYHSLSTLNFLIEIAPMIVIYVGIYILYFRPYYYGHLFYNILLCVTSAASQNRYLKNIYIMYIRDRGSPRAP